MQLDLPTSKSLGRAPTNSPNVDIFPTCNLGPHVAGFDHPPRNTQVKPLVNEVKDQALLGFWTCRDYLGQAIVCFSSSPNLGNPSTRLWLAEQLLVVDFQHLQDNVHLAAFLTPLLCLEAPRGLNCFTTHIDVELFTRVAPCCPSHTSGKSNQLASCRLKVTSHSKWQPANLTKTLHVTLPNSAPCVRRFF